MKNNYEVIEDVTKIFLNSPKYGPQTTLISTSDLERVKEMPYTWFVHWSPQGRTFYVVANIENELGVRTVVKLHRWICNPSESFVVDHINHNTLDNRRENLRAIESKQNAQNREGCNKNNATGIRGVSYRKDSGNYRGRVYVDRKLMFNKTFDTLEEAAIEVQKARAIYQKYSTG